VDLSVGSLVTIPCCFSIGGIASGFEWLELLKKHWSTIWRGKRGLGSATATTPSIDLGTR
jgi:hypothetical protein